MTLTLIYRVLSYGVSSTRATRSNCLLKIRHHFRKQSVSKIETIKSCNNKKLSTKLIFLNEKKSERFGWLRIRILLQKGFQSSVGRK